MFKTMKQLLAIAVLALVVFGTPCLNSDENVGNGIQDEVNMLQVSLNRKQANVKASSSENAVKSKVRVQDDGCEEKMVEIGSGGCYDNNQVPPSLGWSKSTCGTDKPGFASCVATGEITSVEVCEEECLENPDCGGFMHYDKYCWVFGKMLNPNVKYNDHSYWYKCHVKDKCCPGKCCPPFKSCAAWGDPHYTSTFYGGNHLMDFMGLGLYRMATTQDRNFEFQAFQCPYKPGIAIFVGFALKVGGSRISIIGNNVTIDGQKFTTNSGTHSTGLKVETLYAADDKVRLESPDYCIHFSSITFAHAPAPNGYFHNVQLNLADDVASTAGICGSSSGKTPIPESESFFSADENSYLCKMCGIADCATMAPPSDWVPISGPEEACANAGISMTQAEAKCSGVKGDYLTACIYDYCASDGSEDMVANAVETKQEEESQTKELLPLEAQNPDSPQTMNTCKMPYSQCSAWGDPHWTNSFFLKKFDFHGLGVFTMAKTTDGSFEMQGFQCPYGDTWGKVIAGLAMNVGGSRITIIDTDIRINGRLFLGDTHTSGLKVESTHKDRDTVLLQTVDSCVHLKVSSLDTLGPSPGYYQDMFLDMASSVVSWEGVCGKPMPHTRVTRDKTLFADSELDIICSKCKSAHMPDCNFLTTPDTVYDGWFTALQLSDKVTESNATSYYTTLCEKAGVSVDTAMAECKKAMPNEDIADEIIPTVPDDPENVRATIKEYLRKQGDPPAFLNDCVFDYCVSGGNKEFIQNAAEVERQEIRMLMGGIS